MSRAVRIVLSVVVAAAAGWAVYRLDQIYVCNLRAKKAERMIIRMFSLNEQITARITARQILSDMDACIRCFPTDVDQYMVRAAALRMLGRPAEAAMDYRRALHIDRRAELFLNLGQAYLEAGRDEEAKDALITAVYLVYPYVDDLPQPMQQRVRDAVTPTYLMLQQGRAPHSIIDSLRDRVARDPL